MSRARAPYAGVEIGAFEQGTDVAVEMMLMGGSMGIVAMTMRVSVVRMGLAVPRARIVHVRPAVPATRLVHRKARAGQRIVGVVDALDGGDGVEPGALEGRDERRLELGPGVEHRRGEHVARDASDGIELDVHGRYCKSPAGTAHSTRLTTGCARMAHACSVRAVWIPAFAGMTAQTQLMSFP